MRGMRQRGRLCAAAGGRQLLILRRAHRGTAQVGGPIGTLPWYYESKLVTNGDPALAFGPKPDANGHFAWANGSRLYYANLVKHFGQQTNAEPKEFQGIFGVAVSRLDNASPARVARQDSWMPPVIAIWSRNGRST